MYEAIMQRDLTLYEAFVTIDSDDNGQISAAELYGALIWLEAPCVTPEGVLDLMEVADTSRTGFISWEDFNAMLEPQVHEQKEDDDQEADTEDLAVGRKELPPKVEPYGTDILRELYLQRKQEELKKRDKERQEREAYAAAMYVVLYQLF